MTPELQISRGRGVALTVALLLVSFVVAVALGEVMVRLVAPQQLVLIRPDVWQPRDTLGWTRRPNVSSRINTGERTVHIYTDGDGNRVGQAGRVAGARRILLLGDSFMEALQVEYEQSLAGLLERDLSGRLGQPVGVANTGLAGWDPNQYLLQARASLARERFNLVLVALYVGNDVVDQRADYYAPRAPAERHSLRFPDRWTWAGFVDAVLYPVNDALEIRSHLFVLLKARLQTVLMRLRLTESYVPIGIRRSEAESHRWRLTAGICADIARAAAAQGVPTVFVLIPAPQQVDPAVFAQYVRGFGLDSTAIDLDQPNRLMGSALAAENLMVLDALDAFRTAHGTQLYGTVDNHLTAAGHEVLARFVEDSLAGLLARPVSPHSP